MNEQTYSIQLIADNQYSKFYFYTTREELQEYLDETLKISVNEFLENYTLKQSRHFLDWIKFKSSQKEKVSNKEEDLH
ncbi:UNVERIFIED_CONTAM: hypothetical protein ABIC26_002635 [Paenibacillus sp. PvR008]